MYELTNEGQSMLDFTEDSLELICRQIGTNLQSNSRSETEVQITTSNREQRNQMIIVG